MKKISQESKIIKNQKLLKNLNKFKNNQEWIKYFNSLKLSQFVKNIFEF